MKRRRFERTDINEWLDKLERASRSESYGALWKSVHRRVSVSRRRRVSVNLYKINRYSKEGDNIIVPGKVLSAGRMDHSVNITALSFSKGATDRLIGSKSKVLELDEMLKRTKITMIR